MIRVKNVTAPAARDRAPDKIAVFAIRREGSRGRGYGGSSPREMSDEH
jgi:hypothetical protein